MQKNVSTTGRRKQTQNINFLLYFLTFSCSREHTGLRFHGNWNKNHRAAFHFLIGSLVLLQPSYPMGIHPAFYGWGGPPHPGPLLDLNFANKD